MLYRFRISILEEIMRKTLFFNSMTYMEAKKIEPDGSHLYFELSHAKLVQLEKEMEEVLEDGKVIFYLDPESLFQHPLKGREIELEITLCKEYKEGPGADVKIRLI